jgi:HAD superfamily hydrolase (TIGR01549 family)
MARPAARPPRVVLFDMDDTIFDHSLTCRDALERVRGFEPRFTALTLDQMWRGYLEALGAADLTLGTLGHPASSYTDARAARFRALASRAGWACSVAESRALSTLYHRSFQRLRRPVPGAVALVRRLARTYPIGVVTNNPVAGQREKLAFLGLTKTIEYLVVSEAVGAEKPDPAIFRAALSQARARPEEAVMIGDSWTNDVMGARAAGIRPIWFNRFDRPRPSRHRVAEVRSFRPVEPVERAVRSPRPRRTHPRK